MIDNERLLSVYNFIAGHPQAHDQGVWGGFGRESGNFPGGELDVTMVDVTTLEKPDDFDDGISAIGIKRPEVSCGTVACFAGWTCLLNGDRMVLPFSVDQILSSSPPAFIESSEVVGRDKEARYNVSERAADLLGLDDWDRHVLFEANNSRGFLREAVVSLLNQGLIGDDVLARNSDGEFDDMDEITPIIYDSTTNTYV